MDVRNQVKQLLRMCGHAAVSTIHDRLNVLEPQVRDLLEQNTSLARTQTALLEGSIHIIETLRRQNEELRQQAETFQERAEALQRERTQLWQEMRRELGLLREQASRLEQLQQALWQSCLDRIESLQAAQESVLERQAQAAQESERALLASCVERVDQQVANHAGQALQAIADLHNYTRAVFDSEIVRQVSVETDDYGFTNPETGLMSFLYSYLPNRKMVDVGAHMGDVAERLLASGYEVYAFEPYPPVYQKLVDRLGQHQDFHPHNLALGCDEGEMTLHLAKDLSGDKRYNDATAFNSLTSHSMPEDLPFTETTVVPVRSLAGLHRSQVLPEDISLVKIDTEGFDLEVIRGMAGHRYPVVGAEFWDTAIPFGKSGLLYTLETLTGEMKNLGYAWHVVLYRVWGRNQTAYYCNHARAVPNSWGNVFFFRDYAVFAQAQAWCGAVLPRTYFKQAAS